MRTRSGHLLAFVVLLLGGFRPANAQVTWRRTYGGFGTDEGLCVRTTSDGGILVAGSTGSFGAGSSDFYLLRLDGNGDPLWSGVYGGPGAETGVSCVELADGHAIAGTTSLGQHGGYDYMLVRTDQNGAPLWERHYGSTEWDLCHAMVGLPDGFLLGGITYGGGHTTGAAFFVRTDLAGDTLWTRTMATDGRSECLGLHATPDLGAVAAGRVAADNGYDDGYVVRLDMLGDTLWTATVGGDSTDLMRGVSETASGDLVVIGETRSYSPQAQIHLVSLSNAGSLLWERQIGNTSDAGGTAVLTDMQGAVFTGYNTLNLGEPDMILTRTDTDGWFLSGNNYGDGDPAFGSSLDTIANGFVLAGWREGPGPGIRSVFVVRTDDQLMTATTQVMSYTDPLPVEGPDDGQALVLHPNPITKGQYLDLGVRPGLGGEVQLVDRTGRSLHSWSSVEERLSWPDLAPGLYLVRTVDRAGRVVQGRVVAY